MGHKITNVPLILKICDIIFVFGQISLWVISGDILRGLNLFDHLKISLEMVHKVICPQQKKSSPAFSKSAVH
jgi:hypothetical protein